MASGLLEVSKTRSALDSEAHGRLLGRLEHRNLGCTHDESWTVSITPYSVAELIALRHSTS